MFLLVLGVVALATETAFQFREQQNVRAQRDAWWHQHGLFRIHPFLQVSPRPNPDPDIQVNEHGFRGLPLIEGRSVDSLRIFTLGGSTTYSAPLAFPETYPAQLESLLSERAPDLRVEVQNAACDWYSSEHSVIRYLFSIRRFRPDVVIVFHAINDLYRGFAPEWFSVGFFADDYSHYLGPLIGAERRRELAAWFPFQESLLLRWARGERGSQNFEAERFDPFQQGAMRRLRQELRPVAVERFPFFTAEDGQFPDLESMRRGMRSFNDATAAVAAGAGVPLVDLAAAIAPTTEHFSDDVHMTPPALRIVARELADALEAEGLVAPSSPAAP